MWFGSVEYSIPIVEKEGGVGVRVATFFDAGSVGEGTTTFSGNFDDDVGLGLRLNIPHMGPLRLDYGVPITHDKYNGGSGQFQFSAGYTRPVLSWLRRRILLSFPHEKYVTDDSAGFFVDGFHGRLRAGADQDRHGGFAETV